MIKFNRIFSMHMLLPFFLFFVYNISFFSIKQKELSQIESKYTISFDDKKETALPYSTYFKSAIPIILETNKKCLIGDVNKIQIFEGRIYILDNNKAKSLFVFDNNGKFIRKIGSLGKGPGEYIQPMDFTLDMENRFIYLLDYGKRVHKYNLDGTFIKTITPKVQNSNICFILYYNNKLYLSAVAYKPTINDYMLLEANIDDGVIVSKSLPFKYNKGWDKLYFTGYNYFISRVNEPPLYTQLFMNYIVSLGEDITPYIELKSKNLVTDKDIGKLSNNIIGVENMLKSIRDYFQGSLKIYDVHNYIENDEIILFKYQQGWMNSKTIIFNKKTGMVEILKNFKNDLLYKNGENKFFSGFKFFDSKGAYDVLYSIIFESFLESIRNNEIVADLDKLDELRKLDEDANPIIIFYEYQ